MQASVVRIPNNETTNAYYGPHQAPLAPSPWCA